MEHYPITIHAGKGPQQFEVKDYSADMETTRCTFSVFRNGDLVASFRPDRSGQLDLCSNSGHLADDVLHAIIDEIEKINF